MANEQSYLADVTRVFQERWQPAVGSGVMPVAAFAVFVQKSTGLSHVQAGFPKFKNVLEALEKRGILQTLYDSRHVFSVRPPDPACVTAIEPIETVEKYRPVQSLKREVWEAFALGDNGPARYFNRKNGEIRVAVGSQSMLSDEFVEIEPVSNAKLFESAEQFIKNHPQAQHLALDQNDTRWYYHFVTSLRQVSPIVLSSWNRKRSLLVIETAKAWCVQFEVNEDLLFNESRYAAPNITAAVAPTPVSPNAIPLRDQLLEVLRRMTTEELLELKLPAYHMVAVFRPDMCR